MRVADIAAIQDKHVGDCGSLPVAEMAANCRWLSGLCDGAHSRDGAGWSRFDRDGGARLARTPADRWTSQDTDLGRRLSHKYRKQLEQRPPLAELVTPRTASLQRLMGADSVEVIDADAMEESNGQKQQTARETPNEEMATQLPRTQTTAPAGIQLDDSQHAALDLIGRSRVAILTGGPGTGKTTITQQVVRDALEAGHRVAAMAPTGIAAKRLAESIGFQATTIHRALGAIPMGEGLLTTSQEQRDATAAADLVVVDEMSMVTSQLFHHLLKVVKRGARLLLIGDPDQLAPVGSGQPFLDMIESGVFPLARLTTVHRQVEGSSILEACDLVRRGAWFDTAPQPSRDADLVWLEEASEERLADLCEDVLVQAREKFDVGEITLLTPRVTGGTGGNVMLRTEELNRRLQRKLNPDAGLIGGVTAGDPVVCIKNRPSDDVWNGTGGVAVMQNGKLLLQVDDRHVDCIEDCELAYAMSVHKYQGSQNRVIILAAHDSGGKTLTRRLLYTAISRAEERCILLGPRTAFEAAAQAAPRRKTLLRGLLDRQYLEHAMKTKSVEQLVADPRLQTHVSRRTPADMAEVITAQRGGLAFWKMLPAINLGTGEVRA